LRGRTLAFPDVFFTDALYDLREENDEDDELNEEEEWEDDDGEEDTDVWDDE
jgi:hypothetical protein